MRPPWIKSWLTGILMGVSLSLLLANIKIAHADPAMGEKLFKKKLCGACHAIGGKGGKVGPALDGVAGRRDRPWVIQQIKDPKVNNPNAKMQKWNMPEEDLNNLVDYLLTLN